MNVLKQAASWVIESIRKKPVTLTTILQAAYALSLEREWVEVSQTEFLIVQGVIVALFGISTTQVTANVRLGDGSGDS